MMKSLAIAAAVLAFSTSPVAAFPHLMTSPDSPFVKAALEKGLLAKRQGVAAPQGAGALPLVPPPFNATAQYVSNKGVYAVCSSLFPSTSST